MKEPCVGILGSTLDFIPSSMDFSEVEAFDHPGLLSA
jgi:hypothetical protein